MTGTTYMIANPSYQSLPSQLITSPSQVYNRRRSKCPPYYHDRVKMYNMTIDNPDPAGFQSWPRKDYNRDPVRITIVILQKFQSWLDHDFNSYPQGFEPWPCKDLNPDMARIFPSVDKIHKVDDSIKQTKCSENPHRLSKMGQDFWRS